VTNKEDASGRAPPRQFDSVLLPHAGLLRGFRNSLTDWLSEHDIGPPLQTDLIIAAHEAAANAIEHAGSRSEIQIHATLEAGSIRIEVHDKGTWKHRTTERAYERGRGLALIAALVTESQILHDDDGTTLRMSQTLPNR
jgi:anti-sigma regulatory factor (Ser/Thr protein kinase)